MTKTIDYDALIAAIPKATWPNVKMIWGGRNPDGSWAASFDIPLPSAPPPESVIRINGSPCRVTRSEWRKHRVVGSDGNVYPGIAYVEVESIVEPTTP